MLFVDHMQGPCMSILANMLDTESIVHARLRRPKFQKRKDTHHGYASWQNLAHVIRSGPVC